MDNINLSGPSSTGIIDAKSGQEISGTPADFNDTSSESGSNKQAADRGSKKKKGKSNANTKTTAADSSDNLEPVPAKSKKNQRKGKLSSSSPGSDPKSSAKKEESLGVFSEEELCQKITELVPDFEEQGEFCFVLFSFLMYAFFFSR